MKSDLVSPKSQIKFTLPQLVVTLTHKNTHKVTLEVPLLKKKKKKVITYIK
jgi:hypothetical protein